MKRSKNIIYMAVICLSFFFLSDKVKAESFQCKYGQYEGGEWVNKIVFQVNDWNDVHPIGRIGIVKNDYIGEMKMGNGDIYDVYGVDTFYIRTSLFDSKEIMEKEGCPKTIHLSNCQTVFGNSIYYSATNPGSMYADTFVCGFSWSGNKVGGLGSSKHTVTYKEETYKDLDVSDISACTTFNVKFGYIRDAVLSSGGKCTGNAEFDEAYQELSDLCDRYLKNTDYSESGEVKKCAVACTTLSDQIIKLCGSSFIVKNETAECGLGTHLLAWIYKILNWIRYIVPVLLIILGVLDFIKAIAADSEDEMKKAQSKFVKRLIVAIIFFLIPSILQFIFNVFSLPGLDSSNPFCKI